MPQGLQVFNSSGAMILSTTDRLSKVLGIVDVTAAMSGSAYFGALSMGAPYAILGQTDGSPGFIRYSFSGATFNWWKQNDEIYFTPDLSAIRGYFVVGVY